MPFFLPGDPTYFPHPLLADHDGLLCFGPQLSIDNILLAYRFGIFPWYHEDEAVLWWFTHPRFVLYPGKLKISKSLRSCLRKNKYRVSFDTAFEEVINNCKTVHRTGQDDTWITEELKAHFIELHHMGIAHSIEVWEDTELIGGLYGLSLGKVFYGESMFSKRSNASKIAFVKLVQYLKEHKYQLIDCQQETKHLATFGAELISPEKFLNTLRSNIFADHSTKKWNFVDSDDTL